MDSRNVQETNQSTKYKGIRRRKWGKWVSEIRVPGTRQRLWLGSFSTAKGAAVAHDVAFYCLHKPSSLDDEAFNFPDLISSSLDSITTPKSIQKAASDAGMAVDAGLKINNDGVVVSGSSGGLNEDGSFMEDNKELSISVYDYLEDDLV